MGAITAEVVDTGEKRDTSGRRVSNAERRREMVEAYRGSGLTMAAFARHQRINYATFAGWVAKATPGKLGEGADQVCGGGVASGCAGRIDSRCGWRMAPWCAAAEWTKSRRWSEPCAPDMLAFPAGVRIYVAVRPVDMRKSFNGLWAAVSEKIQKWRAVRVHQRGAHATEAAVLGWHGCVGLGETTGEGAVLLAAVSDNRQKIALAPEALAMLVSGVDLKQGTLKPWYER